MKKPKTLGQIAWEGAHGKKVNVQNFGFTWANVWEPTRAEYEKAARAVQREVLRRIKRKTK